VDKDFKVLFLGHSAERTGAPLLLRDFIKFLDGSKQVAPHLLLLSEGPLVDEYQRLCKTDLLGGIKKNKSGILFLIGSAFERLTVHLRGRKVQNIEKQFPLSEFPVIYANTIATTSTAMDLHVSGRTIIQHVHELSYAADILKVRESLLSSVSKTQIFIAASHAVARFLKEEIHVEESKIRVIHEFPVATPDRTQTQYRKAIRDKIGISDEDCLVGMCGTPEWRKGIDLFVQLAKKMNETTGGKRYHFLWVGGTKDQLLEASRDVTTLNLSSNVHFTGNVENAHSYYAAMDLFALTSREDPFSVAMLEAASYGLPIICFDKAGGAPEFVEKDAGIVVPYLDVQRMAEACEKMLGDSELRERTGNAAKLKVDKLYSPEQQMKKLLDVILEILSQPTNSEKN